MHLPVYEQVSAGGVCRYADVLGGSVHNSGAPV